MSFCLLVLCLVGMDDVLYFDLLPIVMVCLCGFLGLRIALVIVILGGAGGDVL